MNERPLWSLPVAVVFAIAPLWSGCAGTTVAVPFEATKAGAILTQLRNQHGGVERFRQFAGVTFSYHVRFGDEVRSFDTVGFRFSDCHHLWIRTSPQAETVLVSVGGSAAPLRGRPVTAIATAASPSQGAVRLHGSRPLEESEGPVRMELFAEPELDLALRCLPLLLEPSLTTSAGRWWYRTLFAPGHADDVRSVEVEPWAPCGIDGTYLLEPDPGTGLLSRVLYRGTHPVIQGRTQLVTLDDYTSVEGIKVARRRVHRRPVDRKERELARNPFLVPPPLRDETFLVERLDGIRFLTAAEADELLPLPAGEHGAVDPRPSRSASGDRPPGERPRIEPPPPESTPLAFPIELAPRSATIYER